MSDNKEILTYDKPDEAIQELFELRLSRYKTDLKKYMKDSDFIFNCVNLLHYEYHKSKMWWIIDRFSCLN